MKLFLAAIISVSGSMATVSAHADEKSPVQACQPTADYDWSKLELSDKVELIASQVLDSSSFDEKTLPSVLTQVQLDELVSVAIADAGTDSIESDRDGMDTVFTYGKPRFVGGSVVTDKNCQPVAVFISIVQRGGATNDESTPAEKHYATEQEALDAGYDTGADVSWQMHGVFEIKGEKFELLSSDPYGEGGFSWTGW
ncbi:MAG: hypothetical protein V4692_06745 [Bdellovibrionota bacterium]